MKWKVEDIGVHANILFDDGERDVDSEPVGVGFPIDLANRLVKIHNKAIDELKETGEKS